MRPLNAIEFNEFVDYIAGPGRDTPWKPEDSPAMVKTLGDGLLRHDFYLTMMRAFEACRLVLNEESAVLTVLALGFNLGREFEERHQTANELERLLKGPSEVSPIKYAGRGAPDPFDSPWDD